MNRLVKVAAAVQLCSVLLLSGCIVVPESDRGYHEGYHEGYRDDYRRDDDRYDDNYRGGYDDYHHNY